MLQLRNEQISHLQTVMEKKFLSRLTKLFSNELEFLEEDPITTLKRLVSRARGYGLSTEFEIAVYVSGAMLLGENFDQSPDMYFGSILRDEDTPPMIKAARLRMEIDRL